MAIKSILSNNEKVVFKFVFSRHDPDLKILSHCLAGKLSDRLGKNVEEDPDVRFVSKLKSTGLKKISEDLIKAANVLRLDVRNPPKKYAEKIKACVLGFNFMLNVKIYLIFLLEEGPVAWYVHESQKCEECKPDGMCMLTLNQIIKERGLKLQNDLLESPIDEKAEYLFEKILRLKK